MDAYNTRYETDGDFGNYASASGYGYMRYVDCNSALALLGFVLFVDLLRDIVETVTTDAAADGGKRRKKRWISTSDDAVVPEMLTFISKGGLQGLEDDFPAVLTDLMSTRFEANVTEEKNNMQGAPMACLQYPLCSANAQLAGNYGTIGAVLAMLTSNLFAQSLPETSLGNRTHSEAKGIGARHSLVLNAAKQGRLGKDCAAAFPSCSSADITAAFGNPGPPPSGAKGFDDHPIRKEGDSAGNIAGLGRNENVAARAPQRPTSFSPSSLLLSRGT